MFMVAFVCGHICVLIESCCTEYSTIPQGVQLLEHARVAELGHVVQGRAAAAVAAFALIGCHCNECVGIMWALYYGLSVARP